MEELILFCRIILALIFLSTAYSKIRNFKQHIHIVKDYEILPEIFIPFFVVLEILIESFTGLLLFIGFYADFATELGLILLIVYSFAVIVNLLRGRRNISCGCGGIAGNHKLSWVLVYRNIILLVMCTLVWGGNTGIASLQMVMVGENWRTIFPISAYETILAAFLVTIFYLVFNNLFVIHKRIQSSFADYLK